MMLIVALMLATGAQTPAPPPALAVATPQPPDRATLAAATELIELMHIDATLDRMYVQLAPVFAQGVIGEMSGDPTGATLLAAISERPDGRERLVAILSQEFLAAMKRQYAALKQGAAQEYAAAFTRDELEAITAFYRSGPGAKALRLQGDLQQKMAQHGRELGRTAGADAGLRALERARRELLELNDKPKA